MALQGWDKNYREQLKIQQQEIESLQQQLMISGGGGGNRPGEDGPYRPPDPKEVPGVPPGYPHIPKMLAHGEYFNEYGVPIQDPTRGMDPSGNPITIPHLQQTPEEAEQNRQLHIMKYHQAMAGPDYIVRRMEDLMDLGYDYDTAGRLAMELSHEKKRLKQELEKLQTEYDEIKPKTPPIKIEITIGTFL